MAAAADVLEEVAASTREVGQSWTTLETGERVLVRTKQEGEGAQTMLEVGVVLTMTMLGVGVEDEVAVQTKLEEEEEVQTRLEEEVQTR